MARWMPWALAAAGSLALLAGCGGGGADGKAGTDGFSTRLAVTIEAPGSRCDAGGSRVDAGLDADRDGVLDPEEVGSTLYVCNGVAGTPGAAGATGAAGADGAAGGHGLNMLVAMVDEPAGAQCTHGGKKISAGLDGDADGVLTGAEITATGYVCNGTNGISTLLAMVAEPAGANCPYGGSKVTSGPDSNANAVLDAGEITSTSYVCTGAPGPGLTWTVVTGTAQQADVQAGYLAANDSAQVVVTLPASAAAGEIVRIAGGGAGGWKVAQNAGQTINGRNLGAEAGVSWMARDTGRNWSALASSADGRRLVAAEYGGFVYTSVDRGQTWQARATDSGRAWRGVASSADGSRLVAVEYGGFVHLSTDGGATWTARLTDMGRDWVSVAASSDGQRLIAAASGDTLYTSVDGGASWTARATDTNRDWSGVASSADGGKLVAVASFDHVYTSTDGGASWTARDDVRSWYAVTSSADGTRLTAVGQGEQIYTSSDSGLTWTARESSRTWYSVASSADGRRLVAVEFSGRIYTSVDAGISWVARESNRLWTSVTSSAVGDSLVAGALGRLYTTTTWTTLGPAGSIDGGAYDSVELQSLGDGRFNVIDHEGSPTVE